jgi:N-acetylneuraminic acid mutarotase
MKRHSLVESLEARFLLASAPAKPSNLAAAVSGASVKLSWLDNSSDETGFKIERSLDGTTYALLKTVSASSVSYTDSAVASGKTYTYRVRATNAAGDSISTAPVNASIVGTDPIPFGGTPIKLPAMIQAENFDNGGQKIAYYDTDTTNLGGVYRQTPVDVTTSSEGGYAIGYIRAGEWLTYTVTAPKSADYAVNLRVANGGLGGTYHLEVDGVKKSNALTFANTGSWKTWKTIAIGKLTLPAGEHEVKIVFDSQNNASDYIGNVNWIEIVGATVTPTGSPFSPANAIVNPVGANQINLAWEDASSNEVGFRIERRITGEANFATIATTKAGVTAYADTSVAPATTYEYQVRSYNNGGASEPTTTLTASTVTPRSKWSWKTAVSSPVGRYEAAGGIINGKLYVLGGYINQDIHATPRSDVYDPIRNTWTQLDDMPVTLTHCGQAIEGTNLWIAGGFVGDHPGDATSDVWKYDAIANNWTKGPSLPLPRGSGALALRGRFLHFFGGLPGAGSKAIAEFGNQWILNLDNLTAGWKVAAAIPTPRGHFSAVSLNNKVYAIGGQHLWDENTGVEDDVDVYDPATNKWTKAAPLPKPLSHTTASTFVLNGKIVVVGGATSFFKTSADIYTYDPATNIWTLGGKLPSQRLTPVAGAFGQQIVVSTGSGGQLIANKDTWWGIPSNSWDIATAAPVQISDAASVAIGSKIYVVGGGTDATLSLDVTTNTWTKTLAKRPFLGDSHNVETIAGKMYVVGGLGAAAGKLQIYNPVTDTWTLGADMPFTVGSAATCVLGQQIYVAGGIIGSSPENRAGTASTDTLARYNPLTNKWTILASMPLARSGAGFGNDGKKFYVFGGREGKDTTTNGTDTVQIYDPAKNIWTISAATLPVARTNLGRATWFNNEFYLVGGETLNGIGSSGGVYSRVDIFNPLTNTWRIGTALPTARQGVAIALISNRLYVIGGGTRSGTTGSVITEVLNLI